MLKPFYQGKLDTFCAIYAVLNALRLTHGLRVLKARDILNETLMGLAATPQAFRAVLEQETDYCALVDGMLRVQRRSFPLEIRQPFAVTDDPAPVKEVQGVAFQAVNRHWTTADSLEGDTLHLFDCSHEAEAILNIHSQDFVTRAEDVSVQRLLHIQPYTVRLLRLPF